MTLELTMANYLGLDAGRSPGVSRYAGMQVYSDPNCLAETTERTFPESRHRSARIHKKLMRRHGGEFKKEPAVFKIGHHTLVAHPVMYAKIMEAAQ